MRHIGVDLHKTNFVACCLAADDTQRLETYPLTRAGLAHSKRQLKQADEEIVGEKAQHIRQHDCYPIRDITQTISITPPSQSS